MRPSKGRKPANGAVIAAARERRTLMLTEVAKLAKAAGYGLDASNLSKLEKGILRYPSLETRLALTRVLGITDAQINAPCEVCGGDWSAACLDHQAAGQQDASAQAGSGAAA